MKNQKKSQYFDKLIIEDYIDEFDIEFDENAIEPFIIEKEKKKKKEKTELLNINQKPQEQIQLYTPIKISREFLMKEEKKKKNIF